MQTQYSVLVYRIDLYFYDHKLALEIEEMVVAKTELRTKILRTKQKKLMLYQILLFVERKN